VVEGDAERLLRSGLAYRGGVVGDVTRIGGSRMAAL